MLILIFDQNETKRGELAGLIGAWIENTRKKEVEFHFFHPADVFTQPIPKAAAAFFAVNNINDSEAARKFNRLWAEIPIVFVCESEYYGSEAYQAKAVHCVEWPLKEEDLAEALERCELPF
jgi:DNA-binding LytR/AlgR family response regulator